ncbi:MAG: hypothetical protein H8D24_02450 [Gammaproteobacteria bacterium]|uniref:Transcriptional regulator n=1 Tax=Candidatus Thiopontia autotrophica TaxID=2841688 RepID=A0A8J6TVP8_9GAMM|nr:hypothetical protein [Candidatus Thiopontia autotrophica]MBL6985342.1 hypothetical protein [Candidatus Thioglobus sp.]
MRNVVREIEAAGLAARIVTESQLARLLDGSPQSRYNLINRAMHRGELLRLRRGRYILPEHISKQQSTPFCIAQALRPGSYISLQSALSLHGWIPESVPTTLSIVPGRRREERDIAPFGRFLFYPLAIEQGYFLEKVERKKLGGCVVLIAQPLRALLDIFCQRKMEYPGLNGLIEGLRIDRENLQTIRMEELQQLRSVYKHKRMHLLIDEMSQDLTTMATISD